MIIYRLAFALIALLTIYTQAAEEREDLSDQLIVSVANLSGKLCTLENIDLHECSITRHSPPTILADRSERSFWISDHSYGFFARKNEVSLSYVCGSEHFTITSIQNSCSTKPYGQVKKSPNSRLAVEFNGLAGHCSNGSPGFIMWRIVAKGGSQSSIEPEKISPTVSNPEPDATPTNAQSDTALEGVSDID